MTVIEKYLAAEQELKSLVIDKLKINNCGNIEIHTIDFTSNKQQIHVCWFLNNHWMEDIFEVAEFES